MEIRWDESKLKETRNTDESNILNRDYERPSNKDRKFGFSSGHTKSDRDLNCSAVAVEQTKHRTTAIKKDINKVVALGPSGLFPLIESTPKQSSKYIGNNGNQNNSDINININNNCDRIDNRKSNTPQSQISMNENQSIFSSTKSNPDDRIMRAPVELKTLLRVISCVTPGTQRMNACGALKSICHVKRNRNRLAHTKGVIPTIIHVLHERAYTEIEKSRCVHALLYLCLEESNYKVILREEDVCQRLGESMLYNSEKVQQISSYCISLVANKLSNRDRIYQNKILMRNLLSVIHRSASRVDVLTSDFVLELSLENRGDDSTSDHCGEKDGTLKSSCAPDVGVAHAIRENILSTFLHLSKARHLAVSLSFTFRSIYH